MFENPFDLLRQTINVLIVDDTLAISLFLKNLLEGFSVYRVDTAETAAEAVQIIEKSKKRFHVCLLDRGISDMERNEFYLLEKYGKLIPFVIVTAREYSDETFEAGKKGARAYIRKATSDFNHDLVCSLNENALLSIVCPRYFEDEKGFLYSSADAMIKNKPQHVQDWAGDLDMLKSGFCKEWKRKVGASPKYALCIFHLFSNMFVHINNACINEDALRRFDIKKCGESLLISTTYKRYLEYFLHNRQTINSYLFRLLPLSPPASTV